MDGSRARTWMAKKSVELRTVGRNEAAYMYVCG